MFFATPRKKFVENAMVLTSKSGQQKARVTALAFYKQWMKNLVGQESSNNLAFTIEITYYQAIFG